MLKKGEEILYTSDDLGHDVELEGFTETMNKKNPSDLWEAEVKNFGWRRANGVKEKFRASDGRTLLSEILPRTDCSFKIFDLEPKGFAIQNFHHDNDTGTEWYHVLPACQEEYHRDWEHNGICVRD